MRGTGAHRMRHGYCAMRFHGEYVFTNQRGPIVTPPFSLSMMIRISVNLGDVLASRRGYIVEARPPERRCQAEQETFPEPAIRRGCGSRNRISVLQSDGIRCILFPSLC